MSAARLFYVRKGPKGPSHTPRELPELGAKFGRIACFKNPGFSRSKLFQGGLVGQRRCQAGHLPIGQLR